MSRTRFWVVACVGALACHGNSDHGERDTKGRSSAVINGDTVAIVDAVAPEASALPKPRVEGAYATVTWPGSITQTTGAAPAIGTSCTLFVHGGMSSTSVSGHDAMSVTCGDKRLFDEHDATSGVTKRMFALREHPVMGEVSAFTYELAAFDRGERTGRNQIDVDTPANKVSVYSDTIPTFRVTIKLAAKRDIRRGKPLFTENIPPFDTVSKWSATLTTSKGSLPFSAKTCELRISPGDTQHKCRVQLECAKTLQYGAGADDYGECTVDQRIVVALTDQKPTPIDGDPSLVADLVAKTATFADEPAGRAPWSATFTLTPLPTSN